MVVALILYRNNRSKQFINGRLHAQKADLEKTLKDLRLTQAQLVQKEKMASLGELTAGIAHEIQNPLNFVNNFSEVSKELVEEMKAAAQKGDVTEVTAVANDVLANLDKVVHHGKRADAIVKGMLQHSSAVSPEKELSDINALVDEYLRLAYRGYRSKDQTFNADFTTRFDPAVEKISIVPQDIGRVLLNLFNNAFYALQMKKQQLNGSFVPVIVVSTQKEGNQVHITVKDNGTGMSQKVAEKIFQPFFTTKPSGKGTGLGLSLSYDIITKGHGGSLSVQSVEGKGSEFVVQLPSS
jgi:signal transduction histidine kinase